MHLLKEGVLFFFTFFCKNCVISIYKNNYFKYNSGSKWNKVEESGDKNANGGISS